MLSVNKYLFLKILNKFKFFLLKPLPYAKSVGVGVGSGTRIMTKNFGTEPYLISIGNGCEITAGVSFITHDGGVWVVRNLYDKYKNIDILKPIIIHDNVYIGNNVTILPGVEICNNVIIGAGSILTKNILESGVYAGIPARKISNIEEYVEKNNKFFSDTKQMNYFEKKIYYTNRFFRND